jgi:hypothetical protein
MTLASQGPHPVRGKGFLDAPERRLKHLLG